MLTFAACLLVQSRPPITHHCSSAIVLMKWCRQEAVAVCTIEKANVTINRLIQEGRLGALHSNA